MNNFTIEFDVKDLVFLNCTFCGNEYIGRNIIHGLKGKESMFGSLCDYCGKGVYSIIHVIDRKYKLLYSLKDKATCPYGSKTTGVIELINVRKRPTEIYDDNEYNRLYFLTMDDYKWSVLCDIHNKMYIKYIEEYILDANNKSYVLPYDEFTVEEE